MNDFPDFFVIGAQKAGTTWFHKNFVRHPQIWISPVKELHYFDEKRYYRNSMLFNRMFGESPIAIRWKRQFRNYLLRKVYKHPRRVQFLAIRWKRQFRNYLLGNTFKRPKGVPSLYVGWHLRYFFGKYTDKWYESLFRNSIGLSGEVNPSYAILDLATIKYMQSRNPKLKIIYVLRNPIDRAWSHAMMHFTKLKNFTYDDITPKSFEDEIRSKNSRDHSAYLRNIKRWNSVFGPDQIFVAFLEDLSHQSVKLINSVLEFLGVIPMDERQVIKRKVHKGSVSKMPTEYAIKIAETYIDEISRLHDVFGGYTAAWLGFAEKLIKDPPVVPSLEYPLAYSSLWPEWAEKSKVQGTIEDERIKFQSAPLSSFPEHHRIVDLA